MQTMVSYQTRGYLLATDTRVTENLSVAFRGMNESGKWANYWDVDDLMRFLAQYEPIRRSYFPEHTGLSMGEHFARWVFADFRGFDMTCPPFLVQS
jgi:hypothetical protein